MKKYLIIIILLINTTANATVYFSDHFSTNWVYTAGDPPSPWDEYFCNPCGSGQIADSLGKTGMGLRYDWSTGIASYGIASPYSATAGLGAVYVGYWWRHSSGWVWGPDNQDKWIYFPQVGGKRNMLSHYGNAVCLFNRLGESSSYGYCSTNLPDSSQSAWLNDTSWHSFVWYINPAGGTLQGWYDGTLITWSGSPQYNGTSFDSGDGNQFVFGYQSRDGWGNQSTYFDDVVIASTKAEVDSFLGIGTDSTAPVITVTNPTGTLAYGTTSTNMSLTTDENATCKYGTSDVAYASLPNTFSTTGTTSHSQTLSGLTNGSSTTYYVRCIDGSSNANSTGQAVTVAVAASPYKTYTTTFQTVENPLSESGAWVNAGSDWTNIAVTSAGFATGTQPGTSYYSDSYALQTGFQDDQQVSSTIKVNDAAHAGEIEVLLRMTKGSTTTAGYECLLNGGGGSELVSWNGSVGSYTSLATGTGGYTPQTGDIWRGKVVGNHITCSQIRNGTETVVINYTDNSNLHSTGQPGIGAFISGANTSAAYGISAVTITDNLSGGDTTPPTITAFTMPSTATSLTVNVSSFTATDDTAVTGYCITTTNSSSGCSWSGSAPATATASSSGAVTWYAWARDAAGNVSNASTQSTTITLPQVTPVMALGADSGCRGCTITH
jgi:hypothetical protein